MGMHKLAQQRATTAQAESEARGIDPEPGHVDSWKELHSHLAGHHRARASHHDASAAHHRGMAEWHEARAK